VFGDKLGKIKKNSIDELSNPKDRWKKGKQLLELQKKFPHDLTIQKLIKEEFKENRKFQYPEEYDVVDRDEDMARRLQLERKMKVKDEGQRQVLLDKFKHQDNEVEFYQDQEKQTKKATTRQFNRFMLDLIQKYK